MLLFQVIGGLIGVPVDFVGLVDGQAKGENVDGVGVVVPVFHQKAAAVCLELRQKLDHPPCLFVVPHKHLQIAEINVKSVLLPPGAQEAFQSSLQTQTVHVHLLVIGDLPLFQAGAQQFSYRCFLLRLFGAEAQALTAVPQESQGSPLQAERIIASLRPAQFCVAHVITSTQFFSARGFAQPWRFTVQYFQHFLPQQYNIFFVFRRDYFPFSVKKRVFYTETFLCSQGRTDRPKECVPWAVCFKYKWRYLEF